MHTQLAKLKLSSYPGSGIQKLGMVICEILMIQFKGVGRCLQFPCGEDTVPGNFIHCKNWWVIVFLLSLGIHLGPF